MARNVGTDYNERASVTEDAHGDVVLSLHRLARPEEGNRDGWDRTDEIVLRPSQAERLAEVLLAYANGDHKLPPDAVQPVRVVQPSETPDDSEFTRGYRQAIADHA